MPKRARSPTLLSPREHQLERFEEEAGLGAKRTDSTLPPTAKRPRRPTPARASLEGSLSEEVLLRCLSFLSLSDLMTVSLVSPAWNRLSHDSLLWRSLYLDAFAPRLSPSSIQRTRPWRELYKISANWRRGSARPSMLGKSVREAVLAEVPKDLGFVGVEESVQEVRQEREERKAETDTILQFYQHYFFTASRTPSAIPTISVHQTVPSGPSILIATLVSSSSPTASPSAITELRLDDRPSLPHSFRLAAFYSTGAFTLFDLVLPTSSSTFSFSELSPPLSSTRSPTPDPILLARLHSPLLVTVSTAFVLRFWRIGAGIEEAGPRLQSRESWWPVVLTLKPVVETVEEEDEWGEKAAEKEGREERYKVTLAYSTPVFPSSWSVGVQEFLVAIPPSTAKRPRQPRISITSRHAIALPRTPPPRDTASRARATDLVTSIEHADPWIVTSRSDNTLDVYEVVSSPPPPPPSPTQLHLTTPPPAPLQVLHRRTLFGHTARVESVAVEKGKCVSGGADGVKVWELGGEGAGLTVVEDLEGGEGVDGGRGVWERGEKGERIRRVWFDEEKIVSVVQGGEGERVRVLRFD